MAEKKKSSSNSNIMDVLSFVAVCVGGIALLVATILGWMGITAGFLGVLRAIANILGWIVLIVLSANFIKSKRKIWMWVVWTAAVVMIVISQVSILIG